MLFHYIHLVIEQLRPESSTITNYEKQGTSLFTVYNGPVMQLVRQILQPLPVAIYGTPATTN